jgi:hypothetical protein
MTGTANDSVRLREQQHRQQRHLVLHFGVEEAEADRLRALAAEGQSTEGSMA